MNRRPSGATPPLGSPAARAKASPWPPSTRPPPKPIRLTFLKSLNPVNRQSAAVSSETFIEDYSDLVDHYFKTITTRKSP